MAELDSELQRDRHAQELVEYLRVPPESLQPSDVWLAGERPLAYLVRTGLLQTAETLLLNPLVTPSINEPGVCSLTALHCAARAGDVRLLTGLLREGARPGACTRDTADMCEDGLVAPGGRTPLHFAAEAGHVEVVSLLLQARAINDRDWHGDSPASLAARQGHTQVCELLQAIHVSSTFADEPPRLHWDPPLLAADAVRARVQQYKRLTDRPELLEPFVVERALTTEECSELLGAVRAAGSRNGWQRQVDALFSTLDLPAHALPPPVYAKLRTALQARVMAAMAAHWRTAPLQMVECFFAWYQAPAADAQPVGGHQAGLALHRDSTLLNCVILLNSDFEGGGTVFADPEHGVQQRTFTPPIGGALCSTGQVRHGAQPLRRGERFVLVAWFDEMVAFEGAQRAMRSVQLGAMLCAQREDGRVEAATGSRLSTKRQLASHSTRTHKRHRVAENPWAGADVAATPLRLVVRIINLRFRPEKLDSTIEMLQRLHVPTGVMLDVEAVVADEGAGATPYPHWKVAIGTGVREPLMEEFWARDVLRGEVGAFVSHLKAVQDVLPDSRDYLLVLEDDAKFEPDFLVNVAQAINELRAADTTWDAIDFGGVAVDEVEPAPVTRSLLRRGCTYLSHCILYSRSGVAKLRQVNRTVNAVVFDEFLPAARGIHPRCEINELWPLGLVVYHPHEALSWQNTTTHDTDASW